jgi:pyruvate dehydrogenase E1 component alpha subunit
MVLTRALDKKAVALQRTGQMGTYAASLGQEAIGTAMGLTLRPDDVFVPSYREQACQILRGVPMQQILQYWGGDERGNVFSGPQQDLPNCVPVATQMTHAAGIATALRIRKQPRAVLVSCGDGATSRGDFYEALNVAGVWKLPMVAVINNNQWAISVRRRQQSVAPTLAQKSIAAGIPGVQVDGNDFIALHAVLSEALARAHAGNGSTLIEAVTYRLCDHTTADDATRYRSAEELSQAWQADPIKRLQTWLHNEGHWDADKEQALQAEVKDRVQQAADDYLATTPQAPESMFDYLYETWPVSLEYQRDQLKHKLSVATRDNREGEL